MEKIAQSNDPLELAIAALDTAIANDNADVAELEGLLAQKRHNLKMLLVEVKALNRAASLRPLPSTTEARAPAQAPAQTPAPAAPAAAESHLGRFRNVVAQIRTGDPRLAASSAL